MEKARKFGKEPKYIMSLGVFTENEYVMFKSNIRPSMKKGLYYCNVTLYKDTGMVASAKCECKVGAVGLCAHIGGLLFRLVQLKHPCTSALCMWNQPPSKNIEPQRLKDINWWPGKADPCKPWPNVYKAGPCDRGEDHAKTFREEILDGLGAVNPDCTLFVHLRKSNFDL